MARKKKLVPENIEEMLVNGGANWDSDFNKMVDAFGRYIEAGNPLSTSDLADAATVIQDVKRRSGDPARLCELAVAWLLLNPVPIETAQASAGRNSAARNWAR